MSKRNNIKWRESDLAELRRVARNYNRNISRRREKLIEQDKRFQASLLPKKVSVKDLRGSITSRKDFNAEIRRMETFNQTGASFVVDANTKKSLEATVRDFNAKADRLSRKARTQGERAALPEKLSVEELLRTHSSKETLVSNIKDFKGFLKRGAEELVELPDTKFNIKITKWQKGSMERRLEAINQNREKELQEWLDTEVKYGGKPAGYTQGQARMYQGDYDEFEPMKMYNWSSEYSDIREKFKVMMREGQGNYWEARTELARINYTEKLERLIGHDARGKMLLRDIKALDLADFKRVLKSEDDLFALVYRLEHSKGEGDDEAYEELLSTIWGEWNPDVDMNEALDGYIQNKTRRM